MARSAAATKADAGRFPRGTRTMPEQGKLFTAVTPLPEGLAYRAEFLAPEEEAELLEAIRALPLEQARYKAWRARRRVVSYGGQYDFDRNELLPAAEPVPAFLEPLRERVSAWTRISAVDFSYALIAEYRPGTQLGWHRDVPSFEHVAGVSLGGPARMRFRPYPPRPGGRTAFALELEPRSAYALTGGARWGWQHAISPTKALRYSITFRTLRAES